MTDKEPDPPPLSPALAYARFACPYCGETRRFEQRLDGGQGGQPFRCKCLAVLGRVEVNKQGYTVLRLRAIDTAPP